MNNLRNCPQCGRLFAYQGRNICSRCLDKEDEDYMIVRKYVRDHPGASVFEVSEETGVEEEKILQFLKDGRLQSKGFTELLECERCGTRISSGRYCLKCRQELDAQIRAVTGKADQEQVKKGSLGSRNREKMYIKDKPSRE
ncbi:TIGR03826 family flagellar region protein [Syntrophomonas erecta]